jgi:hypothetical protein
MIIKKLVAAVIVVVASVSVVAPTSAATQGAPSSPQGLFKRIAQVFSGNAQPSGAQVVSSLTAIEEQQDATRLLVEEQEKAARARAAATKAHEDALALEASVLELSLKAARAAEAAAATVVESAAQDQVANPVTPIASGTAPKKIWKKAAKQPVQVSTPVQVPTEVQEKDDEGQALILFGNTHSVDLKKNEELESTLQKLFSFVYSNSTAITGSIAGVCALVIVTDIVVAWNRLSESSKKAGFAKFIVRWLAHFGARDPKTAALFIGGGAVATGLAVAAVKHFKK